MVRFSNGWDLKRTTMDHLNTELVRYSSPHCSRNILQWGKNDFKSMIYTNGDYFCKILETFNMQKKISGNFWAANTIQMGWLNGFSAVPPVKKQWLLLSHTRQPLVRSHGRVPQHPGGREQVILEVGRLDPGHGKWNRFYRRVQNPESAGKFYGSDVTNVFGKKCQTLVESVGSVRWQREEVGSIFGDFIGWYDTVTLLNNLKLNVNNL